MEKAKRLLEVTKEESDLVSELTVWPHKVNVGPSFYEDFALRGIRVDRVDPGFIACTFRVPPRLIDRNGDLARGAIANLIDIVGNAQVYRVDSPMNVSVDMSISYLSTAKVNDELEVTSRLLGKQGALSGTSVVIRHKASGEIVAEGRHSLFTRFKSKI